MGAVAALLAAWLAVAAAQSPFSLLATASLMTETEANGHAPRGAKAGGPQRSHEDVQEALVVTAKSTNGAQYGWLQIAKGRNLQQRLLSFTGGRPISTGDTLLITLRRKPETPSGPGGSATSNNSSSPGGSGGAPGGRRFLQTTDPTAVDADADTPYQLLSVTIVGAAEPAPIATVVDPFQLRSVVVLLNMCGWTVPHTQQDIYSTLFSNGTGTRQTVEDYFSTCSYGKAAYKQENSIVLGPFQANCSGSYQVVGSIYQSYNSTARCSSYEQSYWALAAIGAARQAGYGYIFDTYRNIRLVVVVPDELNCTWAGYSNIGCSKAMCNMFIKSAAVVEHAVLFHEFMHTFGLTHAFRGDDEYGDQTDIMGAGGVGHPSGYLCFHGANAYKAGWATPYMLTQESTYSPTGVQAVLPPTSVGDRNVLFLNFTKPGVMAYPNYFVTMRSTKRLFDTPMFSEFNNKVHITQYNGSVNSTLISYPYQMTWLGVGESWRSTFRDAGGNTTMGGGIKITVLSIAANTSATINVCFFPYLNESTLELCSNGFDDDCDGLPAALALAPALPRAALTPAAAAQAAQAALASALAASIAAAATLAAATLAAATLSAATLATTSLAAATLAAAALSETTLATAALAGASPTAAVAQAPVSTAACASAQAPQATDASASTPLASALSSPAAHPTSFTAPASQTAIPAPAAHPTPFTAPASQTAVPAPAARSAAAAHATSTAPIPSGTASAAAGPAQAAGPAPAPIPAPAAPIPAEAIASAPIATAAEPQPQPPSPTALVASLELAPRLLPAVKGQESRRAEPTRKSGLVFKGGGGLGEEEALGRRRPWEEAFEAGGRRLG
ncbi:hypothetical protein HYH03_012757 [Edaphochlamys debaryana]|uniref:Peptidase M11 gametolysin domain-containing protein n=1 Tax=Edaphochlamys debaryana TaxID=47281 RepID=A0A835XS62_9CHLO|nr:hypothetical protein HYH03_012757 [Edaphochlamys debaryana]|eukprot:KAG2488759.1 hypothetical protein HYH03_012757 [Edaphochlamys debaryana]